MVMPVVTINKMAMNESVASTCCYRDVVTPTAVYWEVLHGGSIGSGFVGGWVKNPDRAYGVEPAKAFVSTYHFNANKNHSVAADSFKKNDAWRQPHPAKKFSS